MDDSGMYDSQRLLMDDPQRLSKSRPLQPGQSQSQYDVHVFIGLVLVCRSKPSLSSSSSLILEPSPLQQLSHFPTCRQITLLSRRYLPLSPTPASSLHPTLYKLDSAELLYDHQ